MYLIHTNKYGGFSLTQFDEGNIPPYAILSHTWGADGDEVGFEDLTKNLGPERFGSSIKAGYQKLQFCARQAAADGLQHFWVDTCCIKKQSDRELSEAINSMFRWYRRAARCYVYLADFAISDKTRKLSKSRWFTRGWTLQELLAAKQTDFYDMYGAHLGDKERLMKKISRITKIPRAALAGRRLSHFTIEERLSWAQNRQTTREEDGAYSLLGIFDVSMPLIYGEGRDKAYGRLLYEVELVRQTRSAYLRYSEYLPCTKASGPKMFARRYYSVESPPLPRVWRPDDHELIQTWDPASCRWIATYWSELYGRFYRRQYFEGQGWIFLDWI